MTQLSKERRRVLIVEDEGVVAADIERCLEDAGYEVTGIAATAADAIAEAGRQRPDFALMDIRIQGAADGIEAGTALHRRFGVPVIYLTAHSDRDTIERAKEAQPLAFLMKPFKPVELISTIEIALERALADQATRERERSLLAAMGAIGDAVVSTDVQGRVEFMNQAAETLTGWKAAEALGRAVDEVVRIAAESAESGSSGPAGWGTAATECRITPRGGTERWISARATTLARPGGGQTRVAVLQDVTERRLLERQLAQAQKLESIGHLATGIAHEVNTPIQYVRDNVRFLRAGFARLEELLQGYDRLVAAMRGAACGAEYIKELDGMVKTTRVDYLRSEIPRSITDALDGADRVADIVRAMKEFSHPGPPGKTHLEINRAIESTVLVSRNEWKYVADLQLDLDPALPPVLCLPVELNQVILNLIVNAAHAISDVVSADPESRGVITVSTRRDGNWAEIRVKDTGPGIPEPVRPNIFNPFFTTKGIGRGTGQGLAIAHAVIVQKHCGTISFDTTMGEGTTFTVRIPIGPPAEHEDGAGRSLADHLILT